jgi:hypothetical protein
MKSNHRQLRATLAAISLLTASLLAPRPGHTAPPRLGGPLVDGSVLVRNGCGPRFFIVYQDSYALAEWLGGDMVKDGDVLQTTDADSSFLREGRMTLLDLATGRTIDIVIEQALMNRTDFARVASRVCR